jgi:hypothetical protein
VRVWRDAAAHHHIKTGIYGSPEDPSAGVDTAQRVGRGAPRISPKSRSLSNFRKPVDGVNLDLVAEDGIEPSTLGL